MAETSEEPMDIGVESTKEPEEKEEMEVDEDPPQNHGPQNLARVPQYSTASSFEDDDEMVLPFGNRRVTPEMASGTGATYTNAVQETVQGTAQETGQDVEMASDGILDIVLLENLLIRSYAERRQPDNSDGARVEDHQQQTLSTISRRQTEESEERPSQRSTDIFRAYNSLMNEDIALDIDDDDVDDADDENVLNSDNSKASNKRTLAEILVDFELKIDVMETSYINVRRSAIWSDTCRQVLRKRFSPMKRVSVKFADNEGNSEGAVDVGGPKREYFRMVVKAANEDSGIFIGPEGRRSLHPNVIARERDHYRLVGVVVAWSLVHGGPAGNFFSPTLYNSIAYGPGVKPPCVEDIPDSALKRKIIQVMNSSTVEELRGHLRDEAIQSILDAQGASDVPTSVEEREWFAKIISRHVLVDCTRYLLEDLKEGLQTLGILDAIQEYPEQFRDVFTKENIQELDAETVDVLFSIDFAEHGSNERPKQELAIMYWRDYLQDCASGDAQASLAEVLVFATGADVPPTLGFTTTPTIAFTDEAFPTANTCATILRLPTGLQSYEDFKEKMDFSILNSPCFGQA